jgi:hypothetical protein
VKIGFITVLTCMAYLGFSASAQTQNIPTAAGFFEGFLAVSESRCHTRGEKEQYFTAKGETGNAFMARKGEQMMCECVPKQADTVRASLSREELDEPMTDPQFSEKYGGQIMNKCSAALMRSMFGDGCTALWGSSFANSAGYCKCMERSLAFLSDADAAQIGILSSDHLPRAAEARHRGEPAPEQPAILKQYFAIDKSCRQHPQ